MYVNSHEYEHYHHQLTKGKRKVPETHIVFIAGVLIDLIQCNSLRGGQGIHFLYKSFTLYHFTKE